MDDSTIICDEVRESYNEKTKTNPSNFNEKKVTCKTQSFYILLAFLLITIVLLIAVIIHCYLIKHRAKILVKFHDANNKLTKFCIDSINWKWALKIETYYFFNDIIDKKDFDPDNIKTDEKSYKNSLIYLVGYESTKKDLKIYSVNPLYLIFSNVNRCFEGNNGNSI